MISVKTNDLKTNFKELSKSASQGEVIFISRPHNENLYLLSEQDYFELSEYNIEVARQNIIDKIAETEQAIADGAPFYTVDDVLAKLK